MASNNSNGKPIKKKSGIFKKLFILFTILIAIFSGFIVAFYLVTTNTDIVDLPPPKVATVFFDNNNKEFSRLYLENRLEVPLQKIPDIMLKAIINVEDRRFYEHFGIDLQGIARAIKADIISGDFEEGASTITQQLARNVLLTHKKTVSRKVQEIILAIKIERRYSKDEILERYLNQIFFGHGVYGVEAASRFYFAKSVSELELHQIALLIGIPKNPNGYSPFSHPERSKARRSVVLRVMAKQGTITPEEAAFYKAKPLDIVTRNSKKKRASYFRDYILSILKDKLKEIGINEETLYTRGYKIHTTLDMSAQIAAEEAIASFKRGKPDKNGITQPQLALVAIDPHTGHIKAMVGGRDYNNTQLNRAAQAYRQPGSTIKPFVYTAAIDSRQYTPTSIIIDEELSFKTPNGIWKPRNYDNNFRGEISLQAALEKSVNTVAIKLANELGASRIVTYAKKMGLTSIITRGKLNDVNLSAMALGGFTKGVTPLELAAAYTPLANQGISTNPIAILEVKDSNGQTIFQEKTSKKIVLSEATAYIMTDMMRGVILRGTGRAAMIDRPAAGKTGTTSDYTNAWFVGYTPNLLATVWIGNDSQRLPIKINGKKISSSASAKIWGNFMRKTLANTPISDFTIPKGVISGIEVCAETGQLATLNCPEIFYGSYLEGTEPQESCQNHSDYETEFPLEDPLNLENPMNAPESQPGLPAELINEPSNNNNPSPAAPNLETTNNNSNDSTTANSSRDILPPSKPKAKKVFLNICAESGLIAGPHCPPNQTYIEAFLENEQPTGNCDIHQF